jgi:hypothetical protein
MFLIVFSLENFYAYCGGDSIFTKEFATMEIFIKIIEKDFFIKFVKTV